MSRSFRAICLGIGAAALSAVAVAAVSAEPIPDPLSIGQALDLADGHPRTLASDDLAARLPRRPTLFLDCYSLAFSDAAAADIQRGRPLEPLITPEAAQRLEVLERFFDVLLADLSFSRYDEAMAVAYVQFDRASVRRDLGQYSDLRVQELEAVYQDVRQHRTASVAGQRLSRALLASAVGSDAELPRDLVPPPIPERPDQPPDPDRLFSAAAAKNPAVAELIKSRGEADRSLVRAELRQQVLELLLRLDALNAAAQSVRTESALRDLTLDESRTLYEQEVKADLGYSMSQQTKTRLLEQRVEYCRALAWAELDALLGEPVWPDTQGDP